MQIIIEIDEAEGELKGWVTLLEEEIDKKDEEIQDLREMLERAEEKSRMWLEEMQRYGEEISKISGKSYGFEHENKIHKATIKRLEEELTTSRELSDYRYTETQELREEIEKLKEGG